MFDVADLGAQRALIIVDNASRHVVWQQTVIGPDNADHRNIDVWEDIGRREQRCAYAEKRYKQRQNDESIGAPERNLDDPHATILLEKPGCGPYRGTRIRIYIAILTIIPLLDNARPLGPTHRSSKRYVKYQFQCLDPARLRCRRLKTVGTKKSVAMVA